MAITLTGNDVLSKDIEAGVYTPLKFDSKRTSTRSIVNALLVLLLASVGAYLVFSKLTGTSVVQVLPAIWSMVVPAPLVPVVQVFEIIPLFAVPAASYVSSLLIFNNSAVAEGLKAKYHAPEVFNFTGGFLTLNFSVDAQAAPVSSPIVEISVGGTPIWRSATPGSRADADVITSTTKNITEYLSLFENNLTVTFAVLEAGNSPVTASLELVLFNDTTTIAEKKPKKPIGNPSVSALFTAYGPASEIFPLQKKAVELPAETFSVTLPQLASNVTSAKISLFVSASDEEAEFYKKDIAAVGEPVTANGPVRQLNLFVSGIYVGTVSPKPTLFHADKIVEDGAKFWTPVADSGSFSGFTYDVDLVAILPLLWENKQTLEIAIVSPVDSANKAPGVPAALPHPVDAVTNLVSGTWFVSGNLLVWESSLISAAVGAVVSSNSSQLDLGVVIAPPSFTPWQPKVKKEIIRSTIDSVINTSFNFILADNTTASYNLKANSSSALVLTKQVKETKTPMGMPGSGLEATEESASLFSIGTNDFTIEVTEPATNMTLFTKSVGAAYPLSVKSSTKTNPYKPAPETKFSAKLRTGLNTKINSVAGPFIRVDELLKLDDITGSTTDVKVSISDAGKKFFSRDVEVVNGTIISDIEIGPLALSGVFGDIMEFF